MKFIKHVTAVSRERQQLFIYKSFEFVDSYTERNTVGNP